MTSGYDLYSTTFSVDGRIFQLQYAATAANNGGTILGILCQDGLILAAETVSTNKMAVPGKRPRIFAIDKHCAIAVTGLIPDGKEIVRRARLEATEYRKVYDEPIPADILAERVSLFLHAYTLGWSERPFGSAIILGAYDKDVIHHKSDYHLYGIDTTGTCYKYTALALGKNRQIAKNQIDKTNYATLTCEDALPLIARIFHVIHEEGGHQDVELEIGWIKQSSNDVFERFEAAHSAELMEKARQEIEAELKDE